MKASWLIGSYPSLPSQTVDVSDGVSTETKTVSAGDYYMFHPTLTSRSFAHALAAAVNSHSGISDCTVEMTKSGKVRIYRTGGSNFSLTWTDTIGRDMLGLVGNQSGSSSYVGVKSKWWWSPGKQVSSDVAPAGIQGQKLRESVVHMSGLGKVEVVTRNEYRVNDLFWRFVPISRLWTTSESGGEYSAFFDTVCSQGRRFHVWRAVDEDPNDDSTAATLSASLGPYVLREGIDRWIYERGIPFVDRFGHVQMKVVQVTEYT